MKQLFFFRTSFCDTKSVDEASRILRRRRTRHRTRHLRNTTAFLTGATQTTHPYLCQSNEVWKGNSSEIWCNKIHSFYTSNSSCKIIKTNWNLRGPPRYRDPSVSWADDNLRDLNKNLRPEPDHPVSVPRRGGLRSIPVVGDRLNRRRKVLDVSSNNNNSNKFILLLR